MKRLARSHRLRSLFLALFFLGFGGVGQAHETGHGHGAEHMSPHMRAMLEVKEKIPEEYRIMDRTPVIPTPASLARGREIYQENCAVCHGNNGDGKGAAVAGLKSQPANFLDLEHSAVYGPGEKYWLVGHGSGATGMPAFPQFSPTDRWHVVNYILSLQEAKKGERGEHSH